MLDAISLAQMALFNFPLGKRTLRRGVHWTSKSGKGSLGGKSEICDFESQFYDPEKNDNEIKEHLPNEFRRAVHDAIAGREPVGLLLSAGYDSRAILAALLKLGHQPCTITWNVPNPTPEFKIARRLAWFSQGKHFEAIPWGEGDLPSLAEEFAKNSNGLANLVRLRSYSVIRGHHEYMKVLLWGEGELIRPPSFPSEYISPAACHLLNPETYSKPTIPHGFFSPDLPWQEAWQEALDLTARYRTRPLSERLTLWLVDEGYKKVYSALQRAVSSIVPVEMPFMDKNVTELLLRSSYSIARLPSWKPRLVTSARSRRIYYYIIKANAPSLLHVPVDRGYPPLWDGDWRGMVMTGLWGLRQKFSRSKGNSADQPLQRLLKEVLHDPSTLSQDFLNAPAVRKTLEQGTPWPPNTIYELAKIATIVLFIQTQAKSNT